MEEPTSERAAASGIEPKGVGPPVEPARGGTRAAPAAPARRTLARRAAGKAYRVLIRPLRRALNAAHAKKIEHLQSTLTARTGLLQSRLRTNAMRIEKLKASVNLKSERLAEMTETRDRLNARIAILKASIDAKVESAARLREAYRSKCEYYDAARRYAPVYRQGFLFDQLEKAEIDFSADCYLSLLPSTLPAAFGYARVHGGMVVCDCVENIEVHKQSLAPNVHPPALDMINMAAFGGLMMADKILTIGEALAETMRHIGPPVMVAPNYRRLEEPAPNDELREMCGLGESDVLMFASGNVVIGFEPVLEAMAALPEHVHLATLIRFKPPEYNARIEAMIEDLGLSHRVHRFEFVPYERLASLAAGADFGLITSDVANPNGAVSLPNRFFDYLTSGLPVIAPPMPDVVRLLREHGCGVPLPEVNAAEWERAIRAVMADREGYQRAALRARGELTWESLEDDLFEFLGRPERLTMLGFRDLSRYQRFLRIAGTLASRGTRVKAVFLSDDPAPVSIPDAEFYCFVDRYGLGPGPVRVPAVEVGVASDD